MSVAFTIREATNADLEAVASLINLAFEVEYFFKAGDRTSLEGVREHAQKGIFLLAEAADGRLLGSIYFELRGQSGYFGMLSVHPLQQHCGIGGSLIADAERRARAAGCARMEISVINLRVELPPLYGKFGYKLDGRRDELEPSVPVKLPVHLLFMSKPL